MKRVRFVLAIFLFLLAFIFTAELYQNYFRNFYGQFYYFLLEEKQDRGAIRELLETAAEKKDMGVFAVKSQTITALSTELDVYANEKAVQILESEYDIAAGEYKSFFAGTTKVNFHSFEGIEADNTIETFYFTGTMDEVYSVKTIVNQVHATSYIHEGYSEGNNWMIWGVWGLVFGILLVVGWVVIQFEKKENFIKISMGMSSRKIITRNIVTDLTMFLILMFGMKAVLGREISLNYRIEGIMLLFFGFLVIQTLINIIGFRYDYKEIIYGANISMKTLGNCYVLKMISVMLAVISLAICIGLISYHWPYFKMYDEIKKYKEYSFLSYNIDYSDQREDEVLEQVIARKEVNLFYEMYKNKNMALAVSNMKSSDNITFCQVNENTVGVEKLIDGKTEDNFHGVYVLIPKSVENKDEIADRIVESANCNYEGFNSDLEYRIITYDTDFNLLYFDTMASDLEFGFETVENPVMLMASFDFSGLDYENAAVYLNGIQGDIMYKLNGMTASEIEETYGVKDVVITGVQERCEQYKAAILRVVILNVVICLFMLLLEVTIIMTIIRMEYTVNAKELAIKKILGYSVMKKNGFLFITNVISAIAALVLVLVYSAMYDVASFPLIFLSAGILLFMEVILIYGYVIKTERTQTTKILKGGSL